MASGNDAPALWVVNEDGGEQELSFSEMSACSSRIATHLRSLGVRRGDRVLVMLCNEVPLWDLMLAAIKLGAVVSPATTLLAEGDLRDRLERGHMRHVVVAAGLADKFANLEGDYTRLTVGGEVAGCRRFEDGYAASPDFVADSPTRVTDPLLRYFTSGTTATPKLVLHSQQSYPSGHLSTMYWTGVKPGDVHLNIGLPGWAKHPSSRFFAPWNAGATVFACNYARFNAKAMLDVVARCGVTTRCPPPTAWRMLIQEDLKPYRTSIRELIGAGEPLNPEVIHEAEQAWGITIRDGYG